MKSKLFSRSLALALLLSIQATLLVSAEVSATGLFNGRFTPQQVFCAAVEYGSDSFGDFMTVSDMTVPYNASENRAFTEAELAGKYFGFVRLSSAYYEFSGYPAKLMLYNEDGSAACTVSESGKITALSTYCFTYQADGGYDYFISNGKLHNYGDHFIFKPSSYMFIMDSYLTSYAVLGGLAPLSQYAVTFDAAEGDGEPDAVYFAEGAYVTLPDGAPYKDGLSFGGWSQYEGASDADYWPGDQILIWEDVTLYAVWDSVGVTRGLFKAKFDPQQVFGTQASLPEWIMEWEPLTVTNLSLPYNANENRPFTTQELTDKYFGFSDLGTEAYYYDGYPAKLILYHDDGSVDGTVSASGRILALNAYGFIYQSDSGVVTFISNGKMHDYGDDYTYRIDYGMYLSKHMLYNYIVLGDLLPLEQYSLVFNACGGGGAPETQLVLEGTTVSIPAEKPSKDGFSFLGWGEYEGTQYVRYLPGAKTPVLEDITLYAVYTVSQAEIQTNAGLFSGKFGANQVFNCGRTPAYPIADQTFTARGLSGPMIEYMGTPIGLEALENKYFQFVEVDDDHSSPGYPARLNLYNADGTLDMIISPCGYVYALSDDAFLYVSKKEDYGYLFLNGLTGDYYSSYTYTPSCAIVSDQNILYNYNADDTYDLEDKYIIMYYPDGGQALLPHQIGTKGAPLTITAEVPARDGYKCTGWSTLADATKAEYKPGSLYNKDQSAILYPVFKRVNDLQGLFAAKFDMNYIAMAGGAPGKPSAGETNVSLFFIPPYADEQRDFTESELAGRYFMFADIGTSESYEDGYPVRLDVYDNDGTFYKTASSSGTIYALGEKGFLYFADVDNLRYARYFVSNGTPLKYGNVNPEDFIYHADVGHVTDRQTLLDYTAYDADDSDEQYTVTYNTNGGTGGYAAQTAEWGDAVTLAAAVPERDGYAFMGWAEFGYADLAVYQPKDDLTSIRNIQLYAVWKKRLAVTRTYFEQGGKSKFEIYSGAEGMTAKADIEKNQLTEKTDVSLAAAAYSWDGTLEKTWFKSFTVEKGTGTETLEFDIEFTEPLPGDYVKLFVWGKVKTMVPYVSSPEWVYITDWDWDMW